MNDGAAVEGRPTYAQGRRGQHRAGARTSVAHPLLRVILVVAGTAALGWWAAGPVSHWEAVATAFLADQSGLPMTRELPGTNLVHSFHGYQPYFIRITPSCSALTMSAAATGISLFILDGSLRQRLTGALLVLVLLPIGNLARLVAVLWVGRGAGIPTMIRFHDWGGTIFSYLLLLTALLLLVAVRLPRRKSRKQEHDQN